METHNAVITDTMLGDEDHGIFTAMLTCEAAGFTQSFGGYDLRHSDRAVQFIKGVLRVAGASSWERLIGKHVRIRAGHSKIHAIGHIINDEWFDPATMRSLL